MSTVRTEKELAESLKQEEDTIIVEGDLANKVLTIKATGKAAWIIAAGCIAVAVTALLAAPATVGTSSIVSLIGGTAAATILGSNVAVAAVAIAFAAGGIGVLNELRSYDIKEKSNERVVLKR